MWPRKARPSGRARATECGSCITTGLRRATVARSTSAAWSELSERLVRRSCSSGQPQVLQSQGNLGEAGPSTACARLFLAPPMRSLNSATTCRRPRDLRERCGSLIRTSLYQRSNLYLLSGAWVARRFGLPLIEEVNAPYFAERSRHGGLSLSRLAAWSERTAWQRADAVITVTGVLADIVVKVGVPREKLHVMPNGIDEELLEVGRGRSVRQGAPGAFGVHGAWLHGLHSGLERLGRGSGTSGPRGVAPIVSPDCGRRPGARGLERRARELGVDARVRITGFVTRAQVAGYIAAFDVALQPAANLYASPLKLFEYMALGRAVVAPDQPNIREVLTDGTDALLFRASDQDAFAAAVGRLVADAELRKRVGSAASTTVGRRRLTWSNNAQRVIDLAKASLRRQMNAKRWRTGRAFASFD